MIVCAVDVDVTLDISMVYIHSRHPFDLRDNVSEIQVLRGGV